GTLETGAGALMAAGLGTGRDAGAGVRDGRGAGSGVFAEADGSGGADRATGAPLVRNVMPHCLQRIGWLAHSAGMRRSDLQPGHVACMTCAAMISPPWVSQPVRTLHRARRACRTIIQSRRTEVSFGSAKSAHQA